MMNTDQQVHLLNRSIESLGFSKEFKGITEILGFHTLQQLAKRRSVELLRLPGFTLHLLYEYVNFMEDHGLGDYVDPV